MSKYFEDCEFACKCGCGYCKPDPRLLETLDVIRGAIGRSVNVTSGCRCQQRNAQSGGVVAVKYYKPGTKTLDLSKYPRGQSGGAKDSNHTHGTAADIQCAGVSVTNLWVTIKQLWKEGKLPHLAGLGHYDTFVHVDIAPRKALLREWDERKRR